MTVEAESNVAFLENEFSIYCAFIDFVHNFVVHFVKCARIIVNAP